MTVYLIDGHNVLHELLGHIGVVRSRGGAQPLDRPHRELHGGTSDRAIVVFDSSKQRLQKTESATGNVEVYFGSFLTPLC